MTIEELQKLLEANLQVILTGAPGTGKTYVAKEVARKLTDNVPGRIQSVQFHPGYDYSDFVVGMKPVLLLKSGEELEVKEGKCVLAGKSEEIKEIKDAQVSFRWKNGVFKDFAYKAKQAYDDAAAHNVDPPRFVFIIDEINRADLSRVFGELFSLLEEEYRYPNERGMNGVILPNGENLVIPTNLYIIGTMNDIDRSVESMDFALRRRFAWKEVEPEDTADAILANVPKNGTLIAKMNAVNALICARESRLGDEYQLGGAIFAKYKKYDGENNAFESLWNNHIKNILSEYLRGRLDRVEVLDRLKNSYDNAIGIDDNDDNQPVALNQQADGVNQRLFRIVLQDGRVLQGDSAAETLRSFIEYVCNRHREDMQNIMQNINRPGRMPRLLAEEPRADRARYYRQVQGGYYVLTHSDTQAKIMMVNEISQLLHLGAIAERLRED